jgi:thiamine pyrophosphokinase
MFDRKILGVLAGNHMSVARVATWLESAEIVIAADGGLLRVLEAGFVPDVVIGDFDSLSPEMVGSDTQAIVDHSQNSTDCGKLLGYAASQGYKSITLICAEGDLSDHFLDTVHCAVRSEMNVAIGLERGVAHVLTGATDTNFAATPGKRVSLLPLETITNASLSGVEWEFSGKDLSVRGFTSISNMVTQSEVKVSFDEGSAYLFIESDQPHWSI